MAVRIPLLACVVLGGCSSGADFAPKFIGGMGPVGDYSVAVSHFDERRYSGVVRQRYDFSCGSAALATLLRYHYSFDVREDVAFRGMWARGDQDQIRRLGFSLLDMKRWLLSRGVQSDGYKVTLEDVERTGIPGIALISVKNYRHFVVVKGVRGGEVLIGDPSVGLTVMPRKQFQAAWNGVYFVLGDAQLQAKLRFNRVSEWGAFARAPIGTFFTDPVSQQALSLTAPFYGDIS